MPTNSRTAPRPSAPAHAGVIDFSFITPLVADCYSTLDRHAYPPSLFVKLLVLQTGHKTATKTWYSYQVRASVDPSSDIVTAVATTSASAPDVGQLVPLLDHERALFPNTERPIRQATADQTYVGRTDELTRRTILDYTIPRVEHIFAEGKTNHHLGRSRYWTRWKTHIQALLIFLTMNLKRLTNALAPLPTT